MFLTSDMSRLSKCTVLLKGVCFIGTDSFLPVLRRSFHRSTIAMAGKYTWIIKAAIFFASLGMGPVPLILGILTREKRQIGNFRVVKLGLLCKGNKKKYMH